VLIERVSSTQPLRKPDPVSSIPRLAIRTTPRPGESLPSVLLRLSNANGYHAIETLRRLTRVPRTFLTRPGNMENVLLVGGITAAAELEKRSYWPASIEQRLKFGRSSISKLHVDLPYSKVCPSCLEVLGIGRQVWDLRVVTTCWGHECYLLDQCVECGLGLTWRRHRLLGCDCGVHSRVWRAEEHRRGNCFLLVGRGSSDQ
jgi:hypothetical protein